MQSRRQTLRHSAAVLGLLASNGLFAQPALALGNAAFEWKSLQEVIKELGAGALAESSDVTLTVPDLAEIGALVPLSVNTTWPDVWRMLILVENNPAPLIAVFNVSESIEPAFSTRVKMAQSSDVYAVALLADGRAMYARKAVKVTLGSCEA